MTHVHLAHAPWHVGRRPGDVEALVETMLVDGVDVIDPDRHPGALVGRRVAVGPEGRLHATVAPAALRALAQEDLALAGADGPEGGRISPVPALPPAELLEPGKALPDVRDVQDR